MEHLIIGLFVVMVVMGFWVFFIMIPPKEIYALYLEVFIDMKSNWKTVCVLTTLSLLLVISLYSLDKLDIESSNSRSKPISDIDYKITGRARLKSELRDPDSLQIIHEEIIKYPDGNVGYRARYRAKNGFGGYNIEEYYTK